MTADGGGAGGRTEVESTLLVAPEKGEALALEVAGVESLAGHRVRPRDPVVLEDAYLDTPDDELGRAGFALRVRRAGGEVLVAVKGDERRLGAGAARRLELERSWSAGALGEIGELLAGRGLRPPGGEWPEPGEGAVRRGGGERAGGAGAVAALERLGFVVVQRRRTLRRRGTVTPAGGDAAVAELDVDRVGYRLRSGRGRTLVHREVEVEGAGDDGDPVRTLTRALRRRFGDGLRAWGPDKLATGRALDHLAEQGELDALLGPGGELTDRAYARIDALVAEGDG